MSAALAYDLSRANLELEDFGRRICGWRAIFRREALLAIVVHGWPALFGDSLPPDLLSHAQDLSAEQLHELVQQVLRGVCAARSRSEARARYKVALCHAAGVVPELSFLERHDLGLPDPDEDEVPDEDEPAPLLS